jgi:hypothetical protein
MKTWLSSLLLKWAIELMPYSILKEQLLTAQARVRRYQRYKHICEWLEEQPLGFYSFEQIQREMQEVL